MENTRNLNSDRIRYQVILSLLPMLALLLGCDYRSDRETFPPEAPVQLAPVDGETGFPNAVFLEWEKPADATSIQLQFGPNNAFTELLVNEIALTVSIFAVRKLEIDSTYYWRVRAGNAAGLSDWSPAWSLTPTTKAVLPGQPIQVYPPDSTYNLPTTIRFTWEATHDARFFQIQVSLEDDFFRREADMEFISGTRQSVSGLVYGYWYFWRLRAMNAAGYGDWSPARNLVVADAG